MQKVGQKIRQTRETQNLLLRQFAAHIEVDTALMSRADRRERNLNREQVLKLARLLMASEQEFVSLWLCDKIIEAVGEDPLANKEFKRL